MDIYVLGFGRHGDRYSLLAKKQSYKDMEHYDTDGDITEPCWELQMEGAPAPLLQASRELRVKALEQIEILVNTLIEKARAVLKAIEKGRSVVDKL